MRGWGEIERKKMQEERERFEKFTEVVAFKPW